VRIVEGMDHLLSVAGDIPAGTREVAAEVAQWLSQVGVEA